MLFVSIRNLATSVSCQEFICLYSAARWLTPTFLHLPVIGNHTSDLERQRACSYQGLYSDRWPPRYSKWFQWIVLLSLLVCDGFLCVAYSVLMVLSWSVMWNKLIYFELFCSLTCLVGQVITRAKQTILFFYVFFSFCELTKVTTGSSVTDTHSWTVRMNWKRLQHKFLHVLWLVSFRVLLQRGIPLSSGHHRADVCRLLLTDQRGTAVKQQAYVSGRN